MTNGGVNGFPAATASAVVLPAPASGQYFYTASDATAATSGGLGTGTLRVVPWVVTQTLGLSTLGAEVTTTGDSGSKFHIGVYADSGSCYPGLLVVDAGQIAGDSGTVQTLTVSARLSAGLYWVGGAVQVVTTTQPTMRTVTSWQPPVRIPVGTSAPSANQAIVGLQTSSVTGALPSQFPAGATGSGLAARVFARVA